MKMAAVFYGPFLVVLILLFGGIEAACPPQNSSDGRVIDYDVINETQYDMNYSRIGSGRHPYGFYSATWYYNQNKPNPCIRITAPQASMRTLAIKVETVPESRLCFKDQRSTNQCFLGRGQTCRDVPGNPIYIEFLCDNECDEADVTFWYRLALSPLLSDSELWCFDQQDQYPSELIRAPPGATLPTLTTPRPRDTGTASAMRPFLFLLVATVLLSRFFLRLSSEAGLCCV